MLRARLHVKGLFKGVARHYIQTSIILHGDHIKLFLGCGSVEDIHQGLQVLTHGRLSLIQRALGERMEESMSKKRVIFA